MIDLGNYIVSDSILEEYFCCDITNCKGACCVEGDSGAPLTIEEIEAIDENIESIKEFMTPEGIAAIEEYGIFEIDIDGDYTTTLVDGKECAFTIKDGDITLCAIEKAYRSDKLENYKPISCHLYPIRAKEFANGLIGLNYHKWNVCSCAVTKGKQQKTKVYQSLKEPIVRAYGEELYQELCEADKLLESNK